MGVVIGDRIEGDRGRGKEGRCRCEEQGAEDRGIQQTEKGLAWHDIAVANYVYRLEETA